MKGSKYYWLAMMVVAMTALGQSEQSGGSIAGVVQDEKGKPLPHVVVSWYRSEIRSEDRQASQGSTISDEKGQFQFQGLGPATYYICNSSNAARSLVANCAWTRTPPAVVLKSGGAVTGVTLSVVQGVRVEIEFQDDKKLLKGPEVAPGDSALRVGVVTRDGMFNPAVIEGRSASASHYVLVAPPNIPMRLEVNVTGMTLKDSKDANIGQKVVADEMTLARGGSPIKYKFKVEKGAGK